jgi:trigger factor
MQVKETVADGLKHEFQVIVPAADLGTKADARLNDLKGQVRINGFRPGKVPVAHLKKVYGRSVMAETIEQVVRETNNQIFSERGFKLANEPKVTLPTEEKAIEAVLAGKADLDYTVAVEIIPPIALADFKTFAIEKMVADVTDKEVDDQIAKIAEQNRPYAPKADGAKAEKGDRVTISFLGRIGGEAFEGGKGENIPVPIGSNTFIPGFEDQLIGMGVGDSRVVKVTFPVNYGNAQLAGKDAEFETTASLIEAPQAVAVDDEFAKALGLESLDKLKEAVRDRIRGEFDAVSRQRLKRVLLDQLDTTHTFDPPQSLVEEEFNAMWTSITSDMASAGRTFADDNTTEDAAKIDYRKIADRRVRLGLVLAEIGEKNKISVTDEEVSRALIERARQFPGQEKQVWDYYRNNPQALAQLRAPIYEDKVVDYIVELATVTEKKVLREELYKDDDADTPAA